MLIRKFCGSYQDIGGQRRFIRNGWSVTRVLHRDAQGRWMSTEELFELTADKETFFRPKTNYAPFRQGDELGMAVGEEVFNVEEHLRRYSQAGVE